MPLPQFYFIKVGYKGVFISQTCFPDVLKILFDLFTGFHPIVVVGVVGIGHVPGIVLNWKNHQYDINEIIR